MKRLLTITTITVLSFLIFLIGVWFVYHLFYFRDITERLEMMRIPKYPYATLWHSPDPFVLAPVLLDVFFGENVVYFSTNKKPEEVILFYKQKLTQKGWSLLEEEKLYDDKGFHGDYTVWFKKDSHYIHLSTSYYGEKPFDIDWNYSIEIPKYKDMPPR